MTTSNNASLCTYEHPSYRERIGAWNFCADIFYGKRRWEGDQSRSRSYLPKAKDENESEYTFRLSNSFFEHYFSRAIVQSAGVLSRFTYPEALPPKLKESLNNVDLQGNSFAKFLLAADVSALTYGHCFIYVDFPVVGEEFDLNAASERALGLRPYLVLVEVPSVINWNFLPNSTQLEWVTLKENTFQREGDYGVEPVESYRVITPEKTSVYRQEDKELVLVEEIPNTLGLVPIVGYSCHADLGWWRDWPPLLELAELNLKHFRTVAEKDEIRRKCNIPFLQIQEIPNPQGLPAKKKDPDSPIVLGANTALYNVNATYIEPTGAALALTLQDIEKLEQTMRQQTLEFLSSIGTVPRTATEAVLLSLPVGASLEAAMAAKESNVQIMLDLWARYFDLTFDKTISIDRSLHPSSASPSNSPDLRA